LSVKNGWTCRLLSCPGPEDNMKTLLATLLAVSFLTVSLAYAADKAMPPQQEKKKVCNAQAGDKKLEGDARKAFMSDCLKASKVVSV
jgi:hypothetical protein